MSTYTGWKCTATEFVDIADPKRTGKCTNLSAFSFDLAQLADETKKAEVKYIPFKVATTSGEKRIKIKFTNLKSEHYIGDATKDKTEKGARKYENIDIKVSVAGDTKEELNDNIRAFLLLEEIFYSLYNKYMTEQPKIFINPSPTQIKTFAIKRFRNVKSDAKDFELILKESIKAEEEKTGKEYNAMALNGLVFDKTRSIYQFVAIEDEDGNKSMGQPPKDQRLVKNITMGYLHIKKDDLKVNLRIRHQKEPRKGTTRKPDAPPTDAILFCRIYDMNNKEVKEVIVHGKKKKVFVPNPALINGAPITNKNIHELIRRGSIVGGIIEPSISCSNFGICCSLQFADECVVDSSKAEEYNESDLTGYGDEEEYLTSATSTSSPVAKTVSSSDIDFE